MGKHFFKQTIRDIDVRGRTVLVRVDYNVPLKEDGEISDDVRIRASLPTLRYLLSQQCRIVLMSHLGRPEGRDASLSLAPVAQRLAELLERPVRFIDDVVGDKVRQMVRHTPKGGILLLENVRFYKEEEADDMAFARAIVRAVHPDYFVQDGFAVVHRAHASTHALTLLVPSVAGFLVEREYQAITAAMHRPKRPLVAIVGGAKVSDKIELIRQFIHRADAILIGGAMANTFLAHRGCGLGKSFVEPGQQEILDEIYHLAEKKVGAQHVDNFLILPSDVAVLREGEGRPHRREVRVTNIREQDQALDIGTRTIEKFSQIISEAGTIIWNGPMGRAENDLFAVGTARTALAIAQNTKSTSVIGGGDTCDFVLKWDGNDGANFSHVSTGGGASLELMAGRKLPGIESLLDAHGVGVIH